MLHIRFFSIGNVCNQSSLKCILSEKLKYFFERIDNYICFFPKYFLVIFSHLVWHSCCFCSEDPSERGPLCARPCSAGISRRETKSCNILNQNPDFRVLQVSTEPGLSANQNREQVQTIATFEKWSKENRFALHLAASKERSCFVEATTRHFSFHLVNSKIN